MTIRMFPAPPPISGTAPPFGPGERASFRAAALRARVLHLGSVGELAHRELIAYAEFGYRFVGDALVPRRASCAPSINGDPSLRRRGEVCPPRVSGTMRPERR